MLDMKVRTPLMCPLRAEVMGFFATCHARPQLQRCDDVFEFPKHCPLGEGITVRKLELEPQAQKGEGQPQNLRALKL